MPIVHIDHIECRQNRLGQTKAYIAGTRVSVQDIYIAHEYYGQNADAIVADYPHLSLARKARDVTDSATVKPVLWSVTAFSLIQSVTHPSGPEYQELATWHLTTA